MNGKLIAALGFVFVLALAFLFVGRQPQAKGQKPEQAVQWEHKVIFVPTAELSVPFEAPLLVTDRTIKALEEEQRKESNALSKRLNELGADGWEYAGQVGQYICQQTTRAHMNGAFLAFKRPKR